MKPLHKILGIALTCSALALAGCSSTAETPAAVEESTGALAHVTVGIMEIAPAVPVIYGVEQGIFEKHGLEVEYDISRGGAALIPAIEADEYQFGVVNPLSVLSANTRGLDMRILTGFANGPVGRDDVQGIVTRKDSGIETFADLSGKTMAVNILYTPGDLAAIEANERQGGNPDDINFIEIPFPDMAAQLDAGNADAAWLPEPLLAQALADPNNQLLGSATQEVLPGLPMFVSFASQDYIAEHPEIVDKFEAAMAEVLTEAVANEDAVRELLPDFLGIPAEITQHMGLEDWDATLHKDLIEETGALAIKHGFIPDSLGELYRD